MPIDTNLNVSPYFDDFDETKNFHKILFRPSVAVQARELTQLQTILQNQIERFGDNIYRVGTIINGCSLTTDFTYYYIKILDNEADGTTTDINRYANTLLIQTDNNLQSIVVNAKPGLQSQNPDLNTLYIKYLNTGTSGEKTYSNNQLITVFNSSRRVEKVNVVNGGTGYSNSDVVVFTGGEGSGATATLTTFANGTVRAVTLVSKGAGYTSNPSISIVTTTGTSAVLTTQIFISQIRVANNIFSEPVGIGAAIKTSEGVIYQKGHFIRVEAQEEILEKYSSTPGNVAVGFVVNESFVNSSIDTSLLDNAAGSPNFAAPGANRLKLTPQLIVIPREEAAANSQFLSLLEFENGNIVKDRTTTQFNSVNDELSKRTFEESGNYVVNQFPLTTSSIAGNSTHFDLVIGAGLGYIDGNRIELLNNIRIPVKKGIDTSNSSLQTISTSYGSFVVVDQLLGNFNIKTGATVSLRNAVGTDVTDNFGGTPTSPGIQIGTAKVRSLEYESGTPGTPTARYRLYIFDIKMSRGAAFETIRSVSIGGVGVADIVLDNDLARLKDIQNDTLVFNSGTFAVKEFNNETFVFRTSTNGTFQTTGNLALSFSGGNTLPYGVSTLSAALKNQFIIVPTQTITSAVNKTGTVGTANGTTANVTGTGTLFTVQYRVGDYISIQDVATPRRITAIFNDSLLSVSSAPGSISDKTHTIVYPANVPIDFNAQGRIIQVSSNTALSLSLGHTTTATATAVVYHDMQNFEPAVKQKTVRNPVYVKISSSQFNRTTTGPWCLGIPDVYEISGVFIGFQSSYANTDTTNFKDQFVLDNGQKDNYYGLSFIKKKPGSSVNLTADSNLLVELKSFTHGSGKYISTESYPVDDTESFDETNSIRTEQIPFFVSPSLGNNISLRDALDFRPILANTAALASTPAAATIDPSTTETLVTGEKFFPSPTRSFQASIQSFLSRNDRILMESDGTVKVLEGISSNQPSPPSRIKGAMDLGILRVAPFPSLSSKEAADAKRPDLANSIRLSQTKRYTMKNIGEIEDRIRRLEYYTSLSILESNTKNLTLASEANSQIERFKNGFFVDPFSNYDISNLDDPEYRALIDSRNSRLSPIKTVTDIPLKYVSGGQKTGDLITLPYTQSTLISQLYANKERTLVEQNWSFGGLMKVVPSFDNFFDTKVTATSAINIDIATPLQSLTSSINQILATQLISSELITSTTDVERTRRLITTTTTSSFADTFNTINLPTSATNTQEVGSFLTDFTLNPFIREQKIAVYISGLRPGAQHYVFFDNTNLTSNCTPAVLPTFSNASLDSFEVIGARGSALIANNTGEIAVIIDIPGNTFNTGERDILIMDVETLISEESATSKAVGKFSAFNFTGDKTRVTFSTKSFEISPQNSFEASTFSVPRTVVETRTRRRRRDPLAQTFRVQPQIEGSDTIFLTSIDLYFKEKDPLVGVTIEIREVDASGYPTETVIPFSRVYKKSEEVNTSNVASSVTQFVFDSPVAVSVEREYAIVMIPDANSPNYRIWTGLTGVPDILDPSEVMNESWGLGTMFYSVSGSTFTAVQNEDIKFEVRYANFNPLTTTITLQNSDQEFLSVGNTIGTFKGGEDAAQLSTSYINAALQTSTNSNVIGTSIDLSSSLNVGEYIAIIYDTDRITSSNVSVSGTTVSNTSASAFTTDFAVGDFVKIGSGNGEIRQIVSIANNTSLQLDASLFGTYTNNPIFSIDPSFDVLQIKNANSSTITVNKVPKVSTSNTVSGSFQRVVRGTVSLFDSAEGNLYLNNSTSANSTFSIKTSNASYQATIIGGDSLARTNVSNVENIEVSSFKPLINYMVLKGTTISFTGTFVDSSNSSYTQALSLDAENSFNLNDQVVIRSKTNEISGTTISKSAQLTMSMSSARDDMSPVIDINPSSLIAVSYEINNDSTNESTRFGSARAKYISKQLVLANGLEAEDVRAFITAYKPTGTDIKVYAKVISEIDGAPFEEKAWSELQLVSPDVFSSSLDPDDLREYEFTFKQTPASYRLPGVIATSSNSTISGSNTFFLTSFNANTDVDETTDFITLSDNKFVDGDQLTYVVSSDNTVISALDLKIRSEVLTATVNAAGSGYVTGDIVVLDIGGETPARFIVTANGTGNATSVSIVSRGDYLNLSDDQDVSTITITGAGSGLTLDITSADVNGPFFVVQSNTSGVKLSLTENGSPLDLTKGATESGHQLSILDIGDLVKIVKSNSLTDYEIFPVSAVLSSNSIVVSDSVSHTTSGITIEKVTNKNEAFKYVSNPAGSGVVRYFDSNLVPFDGYKALAVKIVLLSDTKYQVPLVNDVRAIAVSV